MVLKKIIRIIVGIGNAISVVCIAVMMVMVVADVIARLIFGHPIRGVTELTQCCWILIALSIGIVVLNDAHTKVDVFVSKMKPLLGKIIILLGNILAFLFCGVLGWRTIVKAMSSKESNTMYTMLGVKEWPFILLFGVSFLIGALALIFLTIEDFRHVPGREIDAVFSGNDMEGGEK